MRKTLLLSGLLLAACAPLQPRFLKNIAEKKAAAIYEQADAYCEEKDYKKAVVELEQIIKGYQKTRAYEPALYLTAFCSFKLNNYDKAISLGERFIREFPHSTYLPQTLVLVGESYLKIDNNYQAVYYLAKYYRQAADTTGKRVALESILKVLPELTTSQLEKLHRIFIADPIDEHILYYLVLAKIKEGKDKDAQRDYALLKKRFPETQYTYEFGEFTKFVQLGEATRRAGVLLPLTGKFASFGSRLREIVQYFEKNKSLGFSIYTVDTKSDPIEATLAAAKLIEEKRVDFLIGPLFSIEAFGVCGFAYGKGTPVIVPAALESKFDLIPTVFAPALTDEQQARLLARYSMHQLDLTKYAVIYPRAAKYEAVGKSFVNEVLRNNGAVVAIETFDPDSVTLRRELLRIKKKNPEAIFLSMDTEMIINTAPQVVYYGLERVKLLGIETFNNEKVPRLGERYVEGAVFIAPAPIDTRASVEPKMEDLKLPDLISAQFFQLFWKLRELGSYTRVNLPALLTEIFKTKGLFNIYQIRGGDFVKLTEMSGE